MFDIEVSHLPIGVARMPYAYAINIHIVDSKSLYLFKKFILYYGFFIGRVPAASSIRIFADSIVCFGHISLFMSSLDVRTRVYTFDHLEDFVSDLLNWADLYPSIYAYGIGFLYKYLPFCIELEELLSLSDFYMDSISDLLFVWYARVLVHYFTELFEYIPFFLRCVYGQYLFYSMLSTLRLY